MKKIYFICAIVTLMICASVSALPIQRLFQDVKLPTQAVMEKYVVINPSAADTTGVLSGSAGPVSAAAVDVVTGLSNPDVPRNILIAPNITTTVAGCTITIYGTNIFNKAITEDFIIAARQAGATTGAKAFKTVSKVSFPANCEDGGFGATWSVGVGEKIGLHRCMDYAGNFVFSTVAGAYESTRGTAVADSDEVEKNTIDFDGTMNGTNDFQAFFIQNFRCFP